MAIERSFLFALHCLLLEIAFPFVQQLLLVLLIAVRCLDASYYGSLETIPAVCCLSGLTSVFAHSAESYHGYDGPSVSTPLSSSFQAPLLSFGTRGSRCLTQAFLGSSSLRLAASIPNFLCSPLSLFPFTSAQGIPSPSFISDRHSSPKSALRAGHVLFHGSSPSSSMVQ